MDLQPTLAGSFTFTTWRGQAPSEGQDLPASQLQDDASIATARVAYDASGLGRCDSCHGLLFE
jgi:hypothetical protein